MNLVTNLDLLTVVFCVATRVRDGEDHGAGCYQKCLVLVWWREYWSKRSKDRDSSLSSTACAPRCLEQAINVEGEVRSSFRRGKSTSSQGGWGCGIGPCPWEGFQTTTHHPPGIITCNKSAQILFFNKLWNVKIRKLMLLWRVKMQLLLCSLLLSDPPWNRQRDHDLGVTI